MAAASVGVMPLESVEGTSRPRIEEDGEAEDADDRRGVEQADVAAEAGLIGLGSIGGCVSVQVGSHGSTRGLSPEWVEANAGVSGRL